MSSRHIRPSRPTILSSRSHLNDLKTLTEDVLYETYRTEKLSKTVTDNRFVLLNIISCVEMPNAPPYSFSQVLPEDLANQSVRLKEDQLRRDEEKVTLVSLHSFLLSQMLRAFPIAA